MLYNAETTKRIKSKGRPESAQTIRRWLLLSLLLQLTTITESPTEGQIVQTRSKRDLPLLSNP